MVLQLAMPQARDIIAIVILIRAHFLFSFGPESTLYFSLVRAFDLEVLVRLEIEVCSKRVAALSLALGVGDGRRVEGFEVRDKAGELCGLQCLFGEFGLFGAWCWHVRRGGVFVEEAWRGGYRAGGVLGCCATPYPRWALSRLQEQSPW